MIAMDRIFDAYNGIGGFSMEFMRKTRERMNWICEQVSGASVLDVGCSQGVGPILLGQAGFTVLGLDINADAVAFANEKLLAEDESVRKAVQFAQGNFATFDFGGRRFDNVIFGEVLEHLLRPEIFIEKAYSTLNDRGRVIVTVPFGINDDPDHKQTFYFSKIKKIIYPYFEITEIRYFGSWIGFVAVRREERVAFVPTGDFEDLENVENAVFKQERQLRDRITQLLDNSRKQNESQKLLKEKVAALNSKCAELVKGKETAEKEIVRQKDQLARQAAEKQALEKKVAQQTSEKQALEKKVAQQAAEKQELEKQVARQTSEKRALEKRIAQHDAALQRVRMDYEKLSRAKLGRLTLAYWRLKDGIKRWLKRAFKRVRANKANASYEKRIVHAKACQTSNGCGYFAKAASKIAVICDRFYYDSVQSAADFSYVTPENWGEVLRKVDVFLVVSTWNGLNNEWQGLATEGSSKRLLLDKLIDYAKSNGVPVVFYSKEDPPHYSDFIGTAKKCDYVFTSCAEKIHDYVADCGHNRVYVMRFGIDPCFHNPIGCNNELRKDGGVIFSGSWYRKFPERCTDLRMIFDGILAAHRPLAIVDRFSNVATPDNRYEFPQAYRDFVHPGVSHDLLQNLHKTFNWSININTVKNSQTMFANRAYELQATGSLLMSNYSIGVNSILPLVYLAHSKEGVGRLLSSFDAEELYERQMASVRYVMTGETCFDRISEMLRIVGKPECTTSRTVAVVVDHVTPEVQQMFDEQSFPSRKLYAIEEFSEKEYRAVDYVAFWSPDSYYGPFYLEDMLNGFKYTQSSYVTKAAFRKDGKLENGIEHGFVSTMQDRHRTVFSCRRFTWEFLRGLNGPQEIDSGYSIDHFNYDEKLDGGWLAGARKRRQSNKKYSVVIPVYNNGWYLYGKALASLLRCRDFANMEIVLVDDGSSDGITPTIVRWLSRKYDNVVAYRFEDGGSGSASRPRNKGVELSTTDYVVFLDPDDEAIPEGYEQLYDTMKRTRSDIVLGDCIIAKDQVNKVGIYSKIHRCFPTDVIKGNGGQLLSQIDFMAIRLHSMMIKKQLMVENGIFHVVGAYGEDTLMSYMLLEASQVTTVVPQCVQIYYAQHPNSAVNNVGAAFFRKYCLCAQPYVKWLRKTGLADSFMNRRFAEYVKGWYFNKLQYVPDDERMESTEILYRMLAEFARIGKVEDPLIVRFLELGEKGDFPAAHQCVMSMP